MNNNPDDITGKYLNEINEIGAIEEGGEKKLTENKYLIGRDVTKNELETNRSTLKDVIE